MERPYQEYEWDKRTRGKKSPAEIKAYLKKLPCSYCGKVERCYCTNKTPRRREIDVGAGGAGKPTLT